jgi:hypothetical protein
VALDLPLGQPDGFTDHTGANAEDASPVRVTPADDQNQRCRLVWHVPQDFIDQ